MTATVTYNIIGFCPSITFNVYEYFNYKQLNIFYYSLFYSIILKNPDNALKILLRIWE